MKEEYHTVLSVQTHHKCTFLDKRLETPEFETEK